MNHTGNLIRHIILLIKIINRIGPKTLPCGTPLRTMHQPEDLPLGKEAGQPLIGTVSNAFAKSK